jgi:hypothetical protein
MSVTHEVLLTFTFDVASLFTSSQACVVSTICCMTNTLLRGQSTSMTGLQPTALFQVRI